MRWTCRQPSEHLIEDLERRAHLIPRHLHDTSLIILDVAVRLVAQGDGFCLCFGGDTDSLCLSESSDLDRFGFSFGVGDHAVGGSVGFGLLSASRSSARVNVARTGRQEREERRAGQGVNAAGHAEAHLALLSLYSSDL